MHVDEQVIAYIESAAAEIRAGSLASPFVHLLFPLCCWDYGGLRLERDACGLPSHTCYSNG